MAQKFTQTLADGGKFGVIGSNHTTNEENFYLQKFAREVLEHQQHRPPPHRRRGDPARRAERQDIGKLATVADLYERKAFLVLGADLALEHPLLSLPDPRQLPASSGARLRGDAASRCAKISTPRPSSRGTRTTNRCATSCKAEPELVILFDDSYQGRRRPQAGRVRRVARHPGEVSSAWWIIPIRAAPSIWASCRNCCPAISASRPAGHDCRRNDWRGV